VSVPTRGEVQDKAAIAECARRIKRSRADFADEKSVTVYGLANLKYETVIEVIDALRGNDEEELFPDVTVAVKR
jgi:biopolymer transport protein ExbD